MEKKRLNKVTLTEMRINHIIRFKNETIHNESRKRNTYVISQEIYHLDNVSDKHFCLN